MEVEYINPFIVGAVEVFEKIANTDLKKSGVQVKKNTQPSNDIVIVFGVIGYVEGQVVYSFKRHTAERIVSFMMPESTPDKINMYFESALGSLSNMITGRATVLLAGKENIIHITPPIIVIDNNIEVKYLELLTVSATFTSRLGSLEINVALKRKQ